tara:strand:- start:257 stop:415 length:159 start_codon:yes stop_codon:yes gene_type:complete
MINRPTKGGKGLNAEFRGMKVSKKPTPSDITENEAMMMDTAGFNKFLAQSQE